jgi:predicted DNA-binding protein
MEVVPKAQTKGTVLQIRLSADLHKQFKDFCWKQGRTMSEVLIEAMEDALDEEATVFGNNVTAVKAG